MQYESYADGLLANVKGMHIQQLVQDTLEVRTTDYASFSAVTIETLSDAIALKGFF